MESEPETYPGDVDALLSIKKAFGIKGWISDPCFVIEWTGIIGNGGLSVRILSINLSERNLYGTLPQRISQLTQLRSIYLQNNSLSGTLPDLCSLTKLQIISLENNYLTGIIQDCLSKLSNLKQLYSGNPHLCMGKDKCQSKGNKFGIFVKSAIDVVDAALFLIILFSIWRKRHNSKKQKQVEIINSDQNAAVIVPNPVKSRPFSLEEMMRATQNLSQKIGEGGFGSVYFGKLQDGKAVAVKLLSSSSKQNLFK